MIYESGENYLEAILKLSKKGERLLAVDIARELGVSKPSVTRAIKVLADKGFLINESKNIRLTDAGQKIANEIAIRHETITGFLVKFGVSEQVAAKDACRIEHYISPETFAAIERAVNN